MALPTKNPAARFDIKATDRTKKAFASVRRNLNKAASSANLMRGAVVALAGAAAIGTLIKRSIDAADSVGKMADTIGISTDALQELRFAADLAGISTEAFDKAMAGFAKRVGEARSGTGTLITLLQKMDPVLLKNVQAAQTADEAFGLVTQAAADMGNALDKSALLAAAFGRTAGTQMKVLLKDGTEGLEAMRQEARDLGLVMSEVLIRQAEQANDDLTRLSSVLKTQVTVAFAELAPFVSAVSIELRNAAVDAGGFGTVVVDSAEVAAVSIAKVGDVIHGLELAWKAAELAGAQVYAFYITKNAELAASMVNLINIIPRIELTIPASLAQSAFDARVNVADLGIELQDLIEQGLPSERIEAFFAQVREGAARTAEVIAATRVGVAPGEGGGVPDEKAALELERLKISQAGKLEVIRAGLLSEGEVETQALLNKLLILEENRELDLISLTTFQTVKENLELQHEGKLAAINKKALIVKTKAEATASKNIIAMRQQVALQSIGIIRQLGSKSEAFAKAALIVEAAIAARKIVIESQVAAVAALVPPPVGLGPIAGQALAAQILAAGQVSAGLALASGALNIASFPSGGEGGGAFGSTPVTRIDPITGVPDTDASNTGIRQNVTEVTVVLRDPGNPSSEYIRNFIELLNDEIDDGAVISKINIS